MKELEFQNLSCRSRMVCVPTPQPWVSHIRTPTIFLGGGGGGADPEATYNLYLILKIILQKTCKKHHAYKKFSYREN
jgi:hypothetical protein